MALDSKGYTGRSALSAASKLLQAPVCTGSGEVVGHVDDILVNAGTGKVEYLSVRPNTSMGSMRVRLTWRDVKVDNLADRVVIIPGGTAAKRLLIRAGLSSRQDAVH